MSQYFLTPFEKDIKMEVDLSNYGKKRNSFKKYCRN